MISNRSRSLRDLFWSVLFVSLLSFCNQNIFAQSDDKFYHVLFIGNSYTYFNSLPQMFKALAENQSPDYPVKVKFIGGGGATLKEHWEVGEAIREIKTGYWNYIILQGQSMLGSNDLTDPDAPREFSNYARKFDERIKESGAEAVYFMTWSRKHLPQQQEYLVKAYNTIGKELESIVAPVGLIWKRFHEISAIELYMHDGSHPTIVGSYLSALTLFSCIYNFIPENLPLRLYGHEILRGGRLSREKTCLCDLSKESIRLQRQAVSDVMFKKKN